MAVMYSFCRYFSVRLGAIVVAVSSLVQSLVLGGAFLYLLNNVTETCEGIENWSSSSKLLYVEGLFQSIQNHTAVYLQWAVVFLMLHISTCALLICAAIQCNVPLAWLFIAVEFLRLAVFSFTHFTAMMLIKENILDLGLLISLSLSGGFLLLGLYYKWFCVVGFCQCVREKEDETGRGGQEKSAMDLSSVNLLASDFSHLTVKIPARAFPSVSMSTIRSRDYQYGNMALPTN